NMSSLMFRRRQVLENIGYWDTVRFAADSEYKKRIAVVFGSSAVKDLDSGPLSFPRQATGSLTSSSAFGYRGFLLCNGREYAEVHRRFHSHVDRLALSYPFNQTKRAYPVPEPLWMKREMKTGGYRHFDVVIIADFRLDGVRHQDTIKEIQLNKQRGLRTGLVQMAHYDFSIKKEIDDSIRQLIDGSHVQMIVYGEFVNAEVMIIKHPGVFEDHQEYIPVIRAKAARGVIEDTFSELRQCTRNASEYAGKEVKWYPVND